MFATEDLLDDAGSTFMTNAIGRRRRWQSERLSDLGLNGAGPRLRHPVLGDGDREPELRLGVTEVAAGAGVAEASRPAQQRWAGRAQVVAQCLGVREANDLVDVSGL